MSMRPARDLMTDHAQRSEALKRAIEAASQGAFTDQHIEVTRPEQSTGGGLRSLQRIRLVPAVGPAIIIGEANLHERHAELRTLGHIQTLHHRRFGKDARIDPEQYLRFSDMAAKVLAEFGVTVVVSALPSSDREASLGMAVNFDASAATSRWWIAAIVLALGAALVWALRTFR